MLKIKSQCDYVNTHEEKHKRNSIQTFFLLQKKSYVQCQKEICEKGLEEGNVVSMMVKLSQSPSEERKHRFTGET